MYPAAYMPMYAKEAGAKLAIINNTPTSFDDVADVVIHHSAGVGNGEDNGKGQDEALSEKMPNIIPIETERLKLVPLDLESINPDDHQKIEQKLGLQLASMILGEQIDREIKAAMRASLEDVIRSKKQDQWYADWQSVLIILKKENAIIGGFCFQRYPDEVRHGSNRLYDQTGVSERGIHDGGSEEGHLMDI